MAALKPEEATAFPGITYYTCFGDRVLTGLDSRVVIPSEGFLFLC